VTSRVRPMPLPGVFSQQVFIAKHNFRVTVLPGLPRKSPNPPMVLSNPSARLLQPTSLPPVPPRCRLKPHQPQHNKQNPFHWRVMFATWTAPGFFSFRMVVSCVTPMGTSTVKPSNSRTEENMKCPIRFLQCVVGVCLFASAAIAGCLCHKKRPTCATCPDEPRPIYIELTGTIPECGGCSVTTTSSLKFSVDCFFDDSSSPSTLGTVGLNTDLTSNTVLRLNGFINITVSTNCSWCGFTTNGNWETRSGAFVHTITVHCQ